MYPFLKDKNVSHLRKDDLWMIRRNVTALVSHKIGGMVVNGTSSILISKFISLAVAGLYSNYTMITNALNSIVAQAFSAITGSVGNLEASENPDKIFTVFLKIYYFNFALIGFCSICLLCLFQPFMFIWVGENYLLDKITVIVLVINFYFNGMRRAILIFRDASASYYYDRWKPLFESVINLTLSIIFIQVFGLTGLLVATTISTLATCSWVEPFVLYRHVFFEKFSGFIKRFFLYTFIIIADCIIAYKISSLIPYKSGLWQFIGLLIFVVFLAAVLMILSTCWCKEFRELLKLTRSILRVLKVKLKIHK